MEFRSLGTKDIQIAPIIFGGNVFGWTLDEKKSFEVLDAFLDAGFNCIDTADVYSGWVPGNSGGESETIIGKWMALRKNRNRVVIATKVGMEFRGEKGLRSDYIIRSVEGSLQRLGVDCIDLYQAHKDDPDTPLEETLKAFEELKKAGKVRVVGASNYGSERLESALKAARSLGVEGYKSLQPQYNLYDRQDFEAGLEGICQDQGISVISYYSLASGFLSGKYRSEKDLCKSVRGQGIKSRYFTDRGFKILQALDELSEELRATPAQLSLAWILHRPSVTAPIVSATSVEQLKDIVKSAQISLNTQQIAKLNSASEWRVKSL